LPHSTAPGFSSLSLSLGSHLLEWPYSFALYTGAGGQGARQFGITRNKFVLTPWNTLKEMSHDNRALLEPVLVLHNVADRLHPLRDHGLKHFKSFLSLLFFKCITYWWLLCV
jgi:hypothetical protein